MPFALGSAGLFNLRTAVDSPMRLRSWFREKLLGEDAGSGDTPPNAAILNTLLGREPVRTPSLGEYDAGSYPVELREELARRAQVTRALLSIEITDAESRIAAIPQLRELLRIYPHPIAYETLIHAYMDEGRYDEAKGIAFAARQRRMECAKSDYPEIRAETNSLREWSSEEIDAVRREREGGE